MASLGAENSLPYVQRIDTIKRSSETKASWQIKIVATSTFPAFLSLSPDIADALKRRKVVEVDLRVAAGRCRNLGCG